MQLGSLKISRLLHEALYSLVFCPVSSSQFSLLGSQVYFLNSGHPPGPAWIPPFSIQLRKFVIIVSLWNDRTHLIYFLPLRDHSSLLYNVQYHANKSIKNHYCLSEWVISWSTFRHYNKVKWNFRLDVYGSYKWHSVLNMVPFHAHMSLSRQQALKLKN